MKTIYLDHAATTPMLPDVIDTMHQVMTDIYGNPSSIHQYGRKARKVLDDARKVLARSIGADLDEVIFTSGGTEADNAAMMSSVHAMAGKGRHIITTEVEHHAILHTCEALEKEGFEITYLPVNDKGQISIEDLREKLREDTILVSVMYGNNEVGSIQPIKEIGELLADHQAIFHTDAVQAYGIIPIDVKDLKVDFLSVSAHKINGPKGIGFLYARKSVPFQPLIYGGEQERKRRAGTENVPGAAGFAKAVELMEQTREEKAQKYTAFKELMVQCFNDAGISYEVNGELAHSLPHVLNISFPGTNVEAFLVNMDLSGIAVSSGSACTAGSIEPSHVLVSMFGKDSERIKNSIRFSFGYGNTADEIKMAAENAIKIVNRLTK